MAVRLAKKCPVCNGTGKIAFTPADRNAEMSRAGQRASERAQVEIKMNSLISPDAIRRAKAEGFIK